MDALKTFMARLIYTLMYIHPGYPEIYTDVLSQLNGYPPPSEEDMQRVAELYKTKTKTGMIQTIYHSWYGTNPTS